MAQTIEGVCTRDKGTGIAYVVEVELLLCVVKLEAVSVIVEQVNGLGESCVGCELDVDGAGLRLHDGEEGCEEGDG